MKKTIAILLAVLVLGACSNEQKAERLIKESMTKALLHPDTYDPVETQLDSAFYPYDSPDFIAKVGDAVESGLKYVELKNKIRDAKSKMALWSSPYDSYSRNQYNEAKKEYKESNAKMSEFMANSRELAAELKAERAKKKEFIGYKAIHRYRANNNDGQTMFGENFFLFDKDLSEVILNFSTDDPEFQLVQEAIRQWQDEE